MLAEEGHDLTVASRRPEKLEPAAEELRAAGVAVEAVPANLTQEDSVKAVVQRHRDAYGRLDVLINNAGLGIGAAVGEIETKRLDMQLDVNLRSYILFYRECADMLRAAGAEHRNAQVVNTASVAGKSGQAWLSVYAATKFGVVGGHLLGAGQGVAVLVVAAEGPQPRPARPRAQLLGPLGLARPRGGGGAIPQRTVLVDGNAEIGVLGVLAQRGLEVRGQDPQLALAGAARASVGAGEAVPSAGEGQEVGAPPAAVRREHRAHAAATVGVGTDDDLVGEN